MTSLTVASLTLKKGRSWLFKSRARSVVAALAVGVLPAIGHAIEEPPYATVRSLDNGIEIREYAPYTVAEVLINADARDPANSAFPILAGYLFGKNKGERTFAMTAPVTQTPAPVKMEMTAPVTQTATAGGFAVQFVLPKGITVASAPEPLDARVVLREMPPQRVGVIRYSGFWSESNYNEHLAKLQAGLRAANIGWAGEPTYSRYDGPMTPWFMRRNEIWLPLAP